jgi:DNA topoisomerase-1
MPRLRRSDVTGPGFTRRRHGRGGLSRTQVVADPDVIPIVQALRRRDPHPDLLAYRNGAGWHDVRSDDVNAYLREVASGEFSVTIAPALDELGAGVEGGQLATQGRVETAVLRMLRQQS